ncbi:MAG: hypothetical protein ACK5WB_00360 [Phycisphaerales bacterium]|jgi:hypothetical protein|nr:hypothetical protein [Phycisphaeraceae bacterium]
MAERIFQSGENVRLKASTLNRWQQAAAAAESRTLGQTTEDSTERPRVLAALNTTATLIEKGQAMALGGPCWEPARVGEDDLVDPSANLFQTRPVMRLIEPAETHVGRTCIAARPILPGAVGPVVVHGMVPALVIITREGQSRASLRAGSRTLHAGEVGEFTIIAAEAGFSGDEEPGHGTPEEPLPLWAMLHLGPLPAGPITIRIDNAEPWEVPGSDPAETRQYRYLYHFTQVAWDTDPESPDFGTWVAKPGGITSADFQPYRAINLLEATHTDTTHRENEWLEQVRPGTIVHAWPQRTTTGETLFAFERPTPNILIGEITAASATEPTVVSSVNYSVKIRGTDQTLTNVRPHWGTPVMPDGIIVPAIVGARALCIRDDNGDGGLGWYLLIQERLEVQVCEPEPAPGPT